MNGDGQSSNNQNNPLDSSKAVFSSANIDSSKARTKTNYFVNLRRGSALEKLSEKFDRQQYQMEVEAKKRAEAEAAARAERQKQADAAVDRFTKKETEIKVPTLVKMKGGVVEPEAAPQPKAEPITRPLPPAPPKIKSAKFASAKQKKITYGIAAGAVFAIAAVAIIWLLNPPEETFKTKTEVPDPSTEVTILDEITDRRADILEIFEAEGAEAGYNAYTDYIESIPATEIKKLSLVYSWRAMDMYSLYREEHANLILSDVSEAETLYPTKGTATLIYLFENEFGDKEKAETYKALAETREESADDIVTKELEKSSKSDKTGSKTTQETSLQNDSDEL